MVSLADLWLPILVSPVFVFLASAILNMALPWHRADFGKVPDEDKVMAALRAFAIPTGDYRVPCPGAMGDLKSPEFLDRMTTGPVMLITVVPPGPPALGAQLGQWFVYCVVVSVFAAYVAGRALGPGDTYLHVFRFAGTTAFVGYSLALWQNTIWHGRHWVATLKSTIDGLIYGLLTAGTFGWLWPR